METWDIYDINRNKTGETCHRGDKFSAGQYHLVVHICFFNSKGEMLIQRRREDKDNWAGYWDVSVGGSALSGENSADAAQREVREELGVIVDLSSRRPNLTVNFFPGYDDVYLVCDDVDVKKLTLQEEEVTDARFASKDEIFRMIDSGEFIPNLKSYLSYIFELKDLAGIKGAVKGYTADIAEG